MLKQFNLNDFETISDKELANTIGGAHYAMDGGGYDYSWMIGLNGIYRAGRYASLTASCDISYVSDAYYTTMQYYPY